MTVAVIIAGRFPLFWGRGTGSEVMQRVAAPMVGGMVTAPLLSMIVVHAAYLLVGPSDDAIPGSCARYRVYAWSWIAVNRGLPHES